MQPASAGRPIAVASGWRVPVNGGDGSFAVRARFVADASGRARLLGGYRRNTSPRTIALHALWRGVAEREDQTRVEAQPQSWLWGAHLPGGHFRAIAFLDPELVRRRRLAGGDAEGLYRELLAESSLFGDLIADARIEGRVITCDATCYSDDDPIGAGWVKIGEAGFAIDPLSSSGVQVAIQTGVTASVAIRTILSERGDAEAASTFFREHQRNAVERHLHLSANLYRDCAAYPAEPFWHRRGAGAPPRPPTPAAPMALEDLLLRRVRLCCDAALVPTPCVVRDLIELKARARPTPHCRCPSPIWAATSWRRCSTGWTGSSRCARRWRTGPDRCRPPRRTRSPTGWPPTGCLPRRQRRRGSIAREITTR